MAACRMSDTFHQHIPVFLDEVIDHLLISSDGIYVDATFGRGGHSKAILNHLSQKGRLIAFDQDEEAVTYAKKEIHDKRFSIYHSSFSRIQMFLQKAGVFGNIHGILFDLGVSSPQLDDQTRGFSFMKEGPLDMRMDKSREMSAMNWLATVDEKTLADILFQYGEEKFSRRIARAIVAARSRSPLKTTTQLANIITAALPSSMRPKDKHAATRSFLAIRIYINQELQELEKALPEALQALAVGGRLAVISFHSLEDRLVKQFIRQQEKGEPLPRGLPIKRSLFNPRLQSVGKPIKPSLQELNTNPRARSAILRIAEKQS